MRTIIRSILPVAIGAAALVASAAARSDRFDLLVRNGTLVDGSGRPATRADVGVSNGVVVKVGRLAGATADRVVDASGLVVAPGFIDVHTHADGLPRNPLAENFLRMGVTTVVSGNCGGSALDLAAALQAVEASRPAVNFATLVGHNTVRTAVMGTEQRRPTTDELERMKALVRKAMADGALGLSTGLQYVPGSSAEAAEIIELARVAGAEGGLYASHMRNEGTDIERAVAETIAVGETARCPVQISHLKIDSPNRWGRSGAVLAMIDAARRRGVEVSADQYAYTAASSGLGIRFPAWALEGGAERIRQRLADEPTWQRIRAGMRALLAERGFTDLSWAVVASYAADPAFNGLSIKQIALKTTGRDNADAQLEVARDMLSKGGAEMVYHLMSEDDVTRIMKHPLVAVASDSSVLVAGEGRPHPRGYGNNARVLGRYAREQKVLGLEEAVRKMTMLPARSFKLVGRGLVAPGYAADLVLFDRARVTDLATFEQPHQFAAGIPYVIVNGAVVIERGVDTGARPGQVIRRQAAGRR